LALLEAGAQVLVLDDLSTGIREAIPPGAGFVLGDSGDSELLARLFSEHRIEAVVHFAAKLVVPDSVADPLGYYLANMVKTRALIEAAVLAGARHFVFSSTAAVYGEASFEPVREDFAVRPASPYGCSKLMSEWMLRDAAAAHGLRYVALRYFNVAGADPAGRLGQNTPNATHLIKVAAQAALGRRASLPIFGTDYPTRDGSCIRDFVHVSDLADAHLIALAHLRQGREGGVFNCGYGRGVSVLEVAEAMARVCGRAFPVERRPRRPGDPAVVVADASRLRDGLGWRPRHEGLDAMLEQTLRWEARLAPT
jgi:UDP-glucose 4-epimerase